MRTPRNSFGDCIAPTLPIGNRRSTPAKTKPFVYAGRATARLHCAKGATTMEVLNFLAFVASMFVIWFISRMIK